MSMNLENSTWDYPNEEQRHLIIQYMEAMNEGNHALADIIMKKITEWEKKDD